MVGWLGLGLIRILATGRKGRGQKGGEGVTKKGIHTYQRATREKSLPATRVW